jgi:hypothetical protein
LLKIFGAGFGGFSTGSDKTHDGQNQHGHDNERHDDEQHPGLDADVAKEPWPLSSYG